MHVRNFFRVVLLVVAGFVAHGALAAQAGLTANDNNTHIDRGVVYTNSAFLTGSGGVAPYTFTATGMPGGVVLNANGTVSGVTCGSNGNFGLSVTVTDATNATATVNSAVLIVNAAPAGGCSLTFTSSAPPNGTSGTPYSFTFTASGGTSPYTYTLASGSLPTGLTLSGGTLSGTPTVNGTYSFTVLVQDAGTNTGSQTYSITISGATAPVAGNVSQTVAYNSGSAVATNVSLSLSGGAATSVAVAAAASHGTASASGTSITYLPTANYVGTDSFTYTATNATGTSSPATVSITVSPPTITVSPATATSGTAGSAYSLTLSASGGLAPYSYAVTAGALPSGVTLSGGALGGTPAAAGTYTFTITATDSSTGTAATGSRAYSLLVNPSAPIAGAVSYSAPYNAGSASAQSVTLNLSGGPAAGVSVASAPTHGTAVASGTTITYLAAANYSGADSFTYTATNAGGTSAAATVTVTVAAPVLTLSPTTLTAGTDGVVYSQSLSTSGGLAPYSYTLVSGSLPSGMTLSGGGVLSGTPTAPGTYTFTIGVTDSGAGTVGTGSRAYSWTVNAGTAVAGAVSYTAPYNAGSASAQSVTLNLSGGAATGVAVATSPAHGTAVASGTAITYLADPNYAGTDSFTYTATNASGTSAAATVSVTVSAPVLTLSPGTLPSATDGTSFSQTFSTGGGLAPYTYTVSAGTLPPGMTLSSGGVLSGTPSPAGTYTFTITATDSGGGTAGTTSTAYTLTVGAPALQAPAVGSVSYSAPYNAGTASAQAVTLNLGGGAAASVAIASAPAHGTAVASGVGITYLAAANYSGADSFTYTATNATGTSSAATVSITVAAPVLTLSPTTLPAGAVGVAYSQALQAGGGLAPYTFTVSAGALPAGLSLQGGALQGTPTTEGSYTFTIAVGDAGGGTPGSASRAYTFTVGPAPLQPPTAGTVTQNATYNAGSGGATTITPNLAGGSATSVAIVTGASHGTATANGTSITYLPNAGYFGTDSFTYTATNAAGTSAPATITVTVVPPVLAVTVTSAPQTLTLDAGASVVPVAGTGGATPYVYSIAPALPAGLTFDTATGRIAGTPTVNSPATTYRVTVLDAAAQSATGDFTLAVTAPVGTLVVSPASLPGVREGEAMDLTLTASGGTAPYTWTVSAGALPSGLVLDANGRLRGRPLAGATFTVTVTDSRGLTGVRAYTLAVVTRPDPAANAGVRSLIAAQAATAERFARGQADNVQSHLRQLGGTVGACGPELGVTLTDGSTPYAREQAPADRGAVDATDPRARREAAAARDAAAQRDCHAQTGARAVAFGFWSGGTLDYGSDDVQQGDRNRFTTRGLTAGVDLGLRGRTVLGAALGVGWDRTKIGADGTRSDARAWSLTMYASTRGAFGVDVDAVVGRVGTRSDAVRRVAEDAVDVTGRRDSTTWFGSFAVRREWRIGEFTMEPSARFDLASSSLDAYAERGATNLALAYDAAASHARSVALDWAVRRDFVLAGATLTPQASLGYRRSGDGAVRQSMRYADWTDGTTYRLEQPALPRDVLTGTIGLRLATRAGLRLQLDWDYSGGGGASTRTLRLGVGAGL